MGAHLGRCPNQFLTDYERLVVYRWGVTAKTEGSSGIFVAGSVSIR